jgi:hypothetical protein
LIALLGVGIVGAGAGIAQAAPAVSARESEKEAELNARQAFAAARYDEAIELFARLYAQTLNPIYLRNIGRCHQKKREADKAIDAFHDYLAKQKSITSSERKEIQGYIKEMEQLRDEQAKEREAQQARPVFAPAPPAPPPTTGPGWGPPSPSGSNGPNGTAPTTINLAPAPNSNGAAYGTPPAGAQPTSGSPVLVSAQGAPPAGDDHPVYTRWWFWTALGVVAAGGIAAALLIPGGVTKPTCPVGECK